MADMANPKIQALLEEFAGRLDRILKEEAVEMLRAQLLGGSPSSGKVPIPGNIVNAIANVAKSVTKPAGKKRGRPKKSAAVVQRAAAAPQPKKRGRPKKPAAITPAKTIADLAPKTQAAAKKSSPKPKAPTPTKPTGAKRNRRSAADLDRDAGRLVAYVRANPGTSTEKARAGLKLEREIWKSTVSHAIATKQLVRKGERRDATLNLA